jgi:hypothetical protein
MRTCRRGFAVHSVQIIPVVTPDRLPKSDEGGRVIPFRPRGAAPGGWRWPSPQSQHPKWPTDDLAKYEHAETEDDYRHRMKMNMLGLIVTIVLMSAGAWLVVTFAEIQKNQDCYLSGRRNCMPIPYETQRG